MPADLVRANPTLEHVRRPIVSVMALGAALSLAGCGASLGGDPQSGLTADQPGVVGLAKMDPRIPLNVVRGGWEGYKGLDAARAASRARADIGR